MQTARFVFCSELLGKPPAIVLLIPEMNSFFFNFSIDFLVDSVPRNSLTIVDPKYYKNVGESKVNHSNNKKCNNVNFHLTYIHFIFHSTSNQDFS